MEQNQNNANTLPGNRTGEPAACPAPGHVPDIAAGPAAGTAASGAAVAPEKRSSPPAKKPPEPRFDRADGIFAPVVLVLGYLFLRWNSLFFAGAGITLFTLSYFLTVLGYARCAGIRPARSSWGWGGFLLAFSMLFLKGIQEGLVFPAFCFLCALASYWTLTVFGARIGGRLDGDFAGDLFNALLRLPFCQFGALPRAVSGLRRVGDVKGAEGAGKQKKRAGLLSPAVLVGGLLTLLLLPPVLLLLAGADAGFERALSWIFEQVQLSPAVFLRVFFSIPVSLYFFGLFSGARYRLHTGPTASQRRAKREERGRLGLAAAAIPTGALLAVYLLFLIAQLPYFFSAFAGLLPSGFTYAEYARRGFFELIAVAAINLGLLLFA